MRFATVNEIEYLSSLGGNGAADVNLIQEMSRRLDALRRYDQYICDADLRPCRDRGSQPAERSEWPS